MSETYFRELLSSIRRSPMVNPGTDSQDKEGKRSLSETGAAVSEDSETVAEIRIPLRLSRDGISGEEIPSYSGSYLSMACYREFNGDWTYWMNGPYFSGRMSGYAFYTVGTVYMDALCQGRNVPKSLADVRIEFTGDLEYQYMVWTNGGTQIVYDLNGTGQINYSTGVRTPVNGVYTVPYTRILQMGYTDFSISVVQNGVVESMVTFVHYVTIILSRKTTIRYGSHINQVFDIHIPSTYSYNSAGSVVYPAVLLIHGGNWTGGSRSDMAGFISHILGQGKICVNMDYRLAVEGSTAVSCASMLADIQTVIGYLSDTCTDCVLNTRIALMGYSAGGHLALLYAYTASAPIPVKMVISIAGPADLTSILDAAPDILQEALPKLTALTGGYDPSDPDFVSRLRAISPRYTYDPKYQQMKTVLVYSSDDQYVNFSDNAVELMSVLYGYAAASELHGLLHEYIPAYVTGVQEGIDSWATPLGCPWPT